MRVCKHAQTAIALSGPRLVNQAIHRNKSMFRNTLVKCSRTVIFPVPFSVSLLLYAIGLHGNLDFGQALTNLEDLCFVTSCHTSF